MRATHRFDVAFYVPSATPLFQPNAELPAGGAETQQFMLARELAHRGYRVVMIVCGDPSALPGRYEGVWVMPQPPASCRSPISRRLVAVRHIRSLSAAHAKTYVRRGVTGMTAVVAGIAKLNGSRFVFAAASALDFQPEKREPDPKRLKLYELGIHLADEIVVQTDEQADLCQRRFGRQARVIRSITEESAPRRGVPEAFLWIGRALENKRPDRYLALARALPEAHFRMIAVPSPADRTGLAQRLQRDAQFIANLELLTPRSRETLPALYDSAVAVVSTSDFEGMPNVFLEAWARGVPALCLTHDPDGVVAQEGLGACAGGSLERLIMLSRQFWESRSRQTEIAGRCRDYIVRKHGLASNVDRWIQALAIDRAQESRTSAVGGIEPDVPRVDAVEGP